MNEKVIIDIVNRIEPQLFWPLLKFIAIGVILLVMRGKLGLFENLMGIIFMKTDVEIKNKEGSR